MQLSLRVKNFANFVDSGEFSISSGINTFIGINNAGKTALLRLLSGLPLIFGVQRTWDQIWREFLLGYGHTGKPLCLELTCEAGIEQIRSALSPFSGVTQNLPENGCDFFRFRLHYIGQQFCLSAVDRIRTSNNGERSEEPIFTSRFGPPNLTTVNNPYGPWRGDWNPSFGGLNAVGALPDGLNVYELKGNCTFLHLLPSVLKRNVILNAHRNPAAKTRDQHSVELQPDAQNLAQLIATANLSTAEMPDSSQQLQQLCEYMCQLFPEIRGIRSESSRVQHDQSREIEIKIDLKSGRSVSLVNSGTGIQQILCVLAGALLTTSTTLFLIDEPHSYLHPSAERGLARILTEICAAREHIFCVATHSPIFASQNRNRLLAAVITNEGSKIVSLLSSRAILDCLGVENMDLFTYDHVLFVEGPSDQAVFQLLLDRSTVADSARTKVVPLGGDGGFKKRKDRNRLLRLLLDANASEARVRTTLIFDSNDWSTGEKTELESIAKSFVDVNVRFLSRPVLEDYLLHPDAVAEVVREQLKVAGAEFDGSLDNRVRQLLAAREGDGATRLKNVFLDFQLEFRKRVHTSMICEAIQRRQPTFLDPLQAELSSACKEPLVGAQPT